MVFNFLDYKLGRESTNNYKVPTFNERDLEELTLIKFNAIDRKYMTPVAHPRIKYANVPLEYKTKILELLMDSELDYFDIAKEQNKRIAGFASAHSPLFIRNEDLFTLMNNKWKLLKKTDKDYVIQPYSLTKTMKLVTEYTGFKYDDMAFLYIICVNPVLHGQGFGNKILSKLEILHKNLPIFLKTTSLMDFDFYEHRGYKRIMNLRNSDNTRRYVYAFSKNTSIMKKINDTKLLIED